VEKAATNEKPRRAAYQAKCNLGLALIGSGIYYFRGHFSIYTAKMLELAALAAG
jgi:hypothetical protein